MVRRVLSAGFMLLLLSSCPQSVIRFPTDGGACAADQTVCAGSCVRVKDSAAHCGECGHACSGDERCVEGLCRAACAPESACTTNVGAPCLKGKTVCGATSTCVDDVAAAAGTSCGDMKVCNGSGSCVGCAEGMSCATNSKGPCTRGSLTCGSGSPVCQDTASVVDAGTSCGLNQVCSAAGACVACAAGSACSDNPEPVCHQGALACASGAPVCVDGAPRAAGTMCDAGVCDTSGHCVACVSGSSCATNPGGPCVSGLLACGSGSAVCNDGSNVAAGTGCGEGLVCDGSGHCNACDAGVACTANPTACLGGATSCATGAATCIDTPSPRDAGSSCGSGYVCDGTGHCGACDAGVSCSTNPTTCARGTTACGSGAQTCVDTSTLRDAGTVCAANKVCSPSGSCVTCEAAAACSGNPNPCRTGTTLCETGNPVCADGPARPNGTQCGGGQVCVSGTCAPTSCANSVRDGFETGIDCGGPNCPKCTVGGACATSADCEPFAACVGCSCQPRNYCPLLTYTENLPCSQYGCTCTCSGQVQDSASCQTSGNVGGTMTCMAPTTQACTPVTDGGCAARHPVTGASLGTVACGSLCTVDGARNGKETDIDCGGGLCPRCASGTHCSANADCVSSACDGGVCAACQPGAPCCTNPNKCVRGVTSCNGGYPVCVDATSQPVDAGLSCGGGGAVCDGDGGCVSCSDGVKNGGETDTDCGGNTSCARCTQAKSCASGSDCKSDAGLNCNGGRCFPDSCMCTADSDCDAGTYCWSGAACLTPGQPPPGMSCDEVNTCGDGKSWCFWAGNGCTSRCHNTTSSCGGGYYGCNFRQN